MTSAIDEAFECMKDAWKPPKYVSLCVGPGLWSIEQWIAYCAVCKPVPLNEFEGMLGEATNRKRWMPAFDDESVRRAIDGMPDCELRRALLARRDQFLK